MECRQFFRHWRQISSKHRHWTATSTTGAPDGRYSHTAVWTGSDMIVWGGTNRRKQFNTGGRYDPGTDNWIATTTTNAPERRAYHTAVWSGSEMLVWGGLSDFGPFYLNTGGRYCAQPGRHPHHCDPGRIWCHERDEFVLDSTVFAPPTDFHCRSNCARRRCSIERFHGEQCWPGLVGSIQGHDNLSAEYSSPAGAQVPTRYIFSSMLLFGS